MTKRISCKICILTKGLKGSELDKCPCVFNSEKEFFKHLKEAHNILVKGGKE